MPDFTTEDAGGFITDTFTTREQTSAPEEGTPEEGASPEPAVPSTPVSLETPLADPAAEELRRQLLADYTRKTQPLGDERRALEAQRAEIDSRQRAFEEERRALDPYRQFDALVAQDPTLADVVRSRVGQIEPGRAQNFSDEATKRMAQIESSMQQMVVSSAEQVLMQKYPDYADMKPFVAQKMQDLGVNYPGHDIVRVTRQLEAAYELATRGKTVQQARTEATRQSLQNVQATRVGVGAPAGGPAPEPDIPMRRPDGRMISYDDLTETLKATMPRRR